MARTKRPKAGAPESQVMAAVVEAARMFGVALDRHNTGAGLNPSGRMVRFGTPGDTDLWGILPSGRALYVEVKAGGFDPAKLRGKKREHFENQLDRMEELNRRGAVAFWTGDATEVVWVLRILRDDPAAVVSFDQDGHPRFTYREG